MTVLKSYTFPNQWKSNMPKRADQSTNGPIHHTLVRGTNENQAIFTIQSSSMLPCKSIIKLNSFTSLITLFFLSFHNRQPNLGRHLSFSGFIPFVLIIKRTPYFSNQCSMIINYLNSLVEK